MFELSFDNQPIQFLEGLPPDINRRIFNKIVKSKEDPLHYFGRLSGHSGYRMKVGQYRVVADLDFASKKIRVSLIGHRKNVYDNLSS